MLFRATGAISKKQKRDVFSEQESADFSFNTNFSLHNQSTESTVGTVYPPYSLACYVAESAQWAALPWRGGGGGRPEQPLVETGLTTSAPPCQPR